jgi:hypothetical protein
MTTGTPGGFIASPCPFKQPFVQLHDPLDVVPFVHFGCD